MNKGFSTGKKLQNIQAIGKKIFDPFWVLMEASVHADEKKNLFFQCMDISINYP